MHNYVARNTILTCAQAHTYTHYVVHLFLVHPDDPFSQTPLVCLYAAGGIPASQPTSKDTLCSDYILPISGIDADISIIRMAGTCQKHALAFCTVSQTAYKYSDRASMSYPFI
jgi:hypothetical protein